MAGQKGRSGPKRKPKELKKAAGTLRPDREPAGVPMPAGLFVGQKPPGLHETAAAEWDRLVPICKKAGVLTDADWPAWSIGFWSYSVVLHCMDYLGSRSLGDWSTEAESGYRQVGPEVAILKSNWAQTLQFCREFGLTASARSGLNIETGGGSGGDPTGDFLN